MLFQNGRKWNLSWPIIHFKTFNANWKKIKKKEILKHRLFKVMHRRRKEKKHTKLSITFLTPQPHDKLVSFFPFFPWSFHLVKHKFPYILFFFFLQLIFTVNGILFRSMSIFDFFYCFSMGKLKSEKKKLCTLFD